MDGYDLGDTVRLPRSARNVAARIGLLLAAGTTLLIASPASAAFPSPPFSQCPPVGFDTSCAVLIVFNADGSVSSFNDPSQPPFDGIEDTLIGVQNNSVSRVTSLTLTGPFIFFFDADGVCSGVNSGGGPGFRPPPAGCPFGP